MKISIALWVVWFAYWMVSASRRLRASNDSQVKREPWIGRLGYGILLTLGFALLFRHPDFAYLSQPIWRAMPVLVGAGLAVQTIGLGFAIWARHTLGENWSGRITVGGSQELIVRGPYRMVRHPIYSGLLLGILGTAIVIGENRAFVGLLLVFVSVTIKLRREEAALRGHFGQAYEDYASRVPALVPWPSGLQHN